MLLELVPTGLAHLYTPLNFRGHDYNKILLIMLNHFHLIITHSRCQPKSIFQKVFAGHYINKVRPVSNVVLLPCRTQMK